MTTPLDDNEELEFQAFEDFDDADSGENPILGWAKAIVFGIGDTAKDMLHEGRRGAREAMADSWDRFDAKTKHRRK